jgi:hypothetical protein
LPGLCRCLFGLVEPVVLFEIVLVVMEVVGAFVVIVIVIVIVIVVVVVDQS